MLNLLWLLVLAVSANSEVEPVQAGGRLYGETCGRHTDCASYCCLLFCCWSPYDCLAREQKAAENTPSPESISENTFLWRGLGMLLVLGFVVIGYLVWRHFKKTSAGSLSTTSEPTQQQELLPSPLIEEPAKGTFPVVKG